MFILKITRSFLVSSILILLSIYIEVSFAQEKSAPGLKSLSQSIIYKQFKDDLRNAGDVVSVNKGIELIRNLEGTWRERAIRKLEGKLENEIEGSDTAALIGNISGLHRSHAVRALLKKMKPGISGDHILLILKDTIDYTRARIIRYLSPLALDSISTDDVAAILGDTSGLRRSRLIELVITKEQINLNGKEVSAILGQYDNYRSKMICELSGRTRKGLSFNEVIMILGGLTKRDRVEAIECLVTKIAYGLTIEEMRLILGNSNTTSYGYQLRCQLGEHIRWKNEPTNIELLIEDLVDKFRVQLRVPTPRCIEFDEYTEKPPVLENKKPDSGGLVSEEERAIESQIEDKKPLIIEDERLRDRVIRYARNVWGVEEALETIGRALNESSWSSPSISIGMKVGALLTVIDILNKISKEDYSGALESGAGWAIPTGVSLAGYPMLSLAGSFGYTVHNVLKGLHRSAKIENINRKFKLYFYYRNRESCTHHQLVIKECGHHNDGWLISKNGTFPNSHPSEFTPAEFYSLAEIMYDLDSKREEVSYEEKALKKELELILDRIN